MTKKFSLNNLLGSLAKILSDQAEPAEKQHRKSPQRLHEEEIANSILVLAAAVVRCNRNYTLDTKNFIRQFFSRQFGTHGLVKRMESVDSHLETGAEPYVRIACKELKILTTHDSRINMVHFLFGVAASDDFINARETRAIQRIAGYLGISDSDFKEIKRSFLHDNNPYKLLGLDEDATREQVRTAYRKMVLKYHPDKRGALTGEDANIKFREVQRAFELIKKEWDKL